MWERYIPAGRRSQGQGARCQSPRSEPNRSLERLGAPPANGDGAPRANHSAPSTRTGSTARRAPCRDVACNKRHRGQQHRYGNECRPVARATSNSRLARSRVRAADRKRPSSAGWAAGQRTASGAPEWAPRRRLAYSAPQGLVYPRPTCQAVVLTGSRCSRDRSRRGPRDRRRQRALARSGMTGATRNAVRSAGPTVKCVAPAGCPACRACPVRR